MRNLVLAVAGMVLLVGCTQIVEKAGGDIQMCMQKCSDLCELAKDSNMSMEGFNSIGLTKQSGSVKVSCSCPCA